MTVQLSNAAVAALLLLSLSAPCDAKTMNGRPGQYKIANGDPVASYNSGGTTYSTDYDRNETEYFEVYSDLIRTRYSEVHWRMSSPIPLPDGIVSRFRNKVMAVVGYEVDQVFESNGKSVPITYAYNHHYCAWLLNREKVTLVKQKRGTHDGDGDAVYAMGLNHGSDEHWVPKPLGGGVDEISAESYPTNQFFSEGNGGEFRMSYHGYPKGFAQLIESPDTFQTIPMQIDTWNREEMDSPKFAPGPLPKNSDAPSDAGYSGLLECPCSDRIEKTWAMTYMLQSSGSCADPVQNATECFASARTVVQSETYRDNTIRDTSRQAGCSIEQHSDGSSDIWWNMIEGEYPSAAEKEAVVEEAPPTAVSAFSQAQVNLTVTLNSTESEDAVRITIVGPADRWFGVGFGSSSMCVHMQSDQCPGGGPYAIVVGGDGRDGSAIIERRLDFHGPGRVIAPSVSFESDSVKGENRTVVLTRPMRGATDAHYTFDPSETHVPIIAARGCGGPAFEQHCGHGPSMLNFLGTDLPTLICRAGVEGAIGGNRFANRGRCAPFPRGDLLAQKNPTCRIETYRGGLMCCRDGHSLLDKDQDLPWPDRYLEYRLKFRFYFEEYRPEVRTADGVASVSAAPSHRDLVRFFVATEANAGEYDVAACAEGTPPSQCVHVITARWTVRDMTPTDGAATEGIQLIYAGPHCHAPTCISMDLYNADTGQLICHSEPIRGTGDVEHDPYDELGFIAIPPCLWGDASEGLMEPQLLTLDTTVMSVKRSNSTMPHTGEMALWQMRGVIVQKDGAARDGGDGDGPILPLVNSASVVGLERMADGLADRRGRLRNSAH